MSITGLESRARLVAPTRAQNKLAGSLLGAAKPASALWAGSVGNARKIPLLGFSIDNMLLHSAAHEVAVAARDGRKARVVFVNAHAANTAMADSDYQQTVATADRIFADGSGLSTIDRVMNPARLYLSPPVNITMVPPPGAGHKSHR